MATILRKTDIRLRVKMVGEFLILKLVKEDEIKCENRKKKSFSWIIHENITLLGG